MSITDFLFQGQTPPVVDSTTNTQGSLPLWYSQYLQALTNKSSAIAGEEYTPYTGPRNVGPTASHQQAWTGLAGNINNWQGAQNGAVGMATAGGAPFSQSGLSQFMSPYTEGVTNEIARQGMRLFNEQLLPGVNDQFTMSGQFGSKRHMDFTGRAMRDTVESITGQQAMANQNAIQSAMQNYGNFQGLQLQGAGALGQLANQQQQGDIRTAGALASIGQDQNQFDQQSYNTAYNDFLEQRNWPKDQAQFMSQILRGMNPPTSTSTTGSAPYNGYMSPSPLAQLAGLLSGAAGATSQRPVAHGGLIRRYAGGGGVRRPNMETHLRMSVPVMRRQTLRGVSGLGQLRLA